MALEKALGYGLSSHDAYNESPEPKLVLLTNLNRLSPESACKTTDQRDCGIGAGSRISRATSSLIVQESI
ncbi:hypothetical protein Sjap_012108 [Stephania japonica]|uniref:Uncharacterized protein n=1 Tax=Stephania japonica TaxID=461633 RepID=A0AAP0IXS5_9MAGN